MQIGIIGAGLVGSTLASRLAGAGHQVRVANSRGPETLPALQGQPGVTPSWAVEAVAGVDLAILAVPMSAVGSLPAEVVAGLAAAPVVIDTGNYYPLRDGRIDALDRGMADSAWVAQQLGRPVHKAFNNMIAPSIKHKATDDPDARLGLTVAGPAGTAGDLVFSVVDQVGFHPVDGGDLEQSWRLQPGTPTYCRDLPPAELLEALRSTHAADRDSYNAVRDQPKDFEAVMAALARRM